MTVGAEALGRWGAEQPQIGIPTQLRRVHRHRAAVFQRRLDIIQRRHPREHFPLQELERCPATGRHVRHSVGEPRFGDRRRRVAAPDDGDDPLPGGLRHRLGDCSGAVIERRGLEHAHRPIPHHGPGRRDPPGEFHFGPGIDIEHRPPDGDPLAGHGAGRDAHRKLLGDDGSGGQDELRTRLLQEALRHLHPVALDQGVAGLEPHRLEKGAGHRAADQDGVDLGKQRLDEVDLP